MSTAGGELKATLSLQRKAAIVQGGAFDHAGKVRVDRTKTAPIDETRTLFGRITDLLPAAITLKLARKSIQDYSEQAGHDLSYRIAWTT